MNRKGDEALTAFDIPCPRCEQSDANRQQPVLCQPIDRQSSEETLSNTYAPHGGAKTEMFNQMTLLKANIE